MQSVPLTTTDAKVLAQVFDPEGNLAKAEVAIDPGLPIDRHVPDETVIAQLRSRERDAVGLVEAFEASKYKASSDRTRTYSKALVSLDAIVAEYPKYASARNNRAQLRRWRYGDRNMLCQPGSAIDSERVAAVSAIEDDLREAITLAQPRKPGDAVSPSQGRLLGQAYTQLAALQYAASEDLASGHIAILVGNDQQSQKQNFEEEASRLFYLGGLYGNEVAKALAVHTNPHAKLCGNIVQEAMRKEMSHA